MRALTPMLVTGARGSASEAGEGLIHHLYAEGATRRETTISLARIPESVAFVPALVCRDRRTMGGASPAQLPAESWAETTLESGAFNERYRLLALSGQDAGLVRELFSPALIAWLASEAPAGLSFEINDGNLAVALPGRISDPEGLAQLRGAATELAEWIRAEIAEEELDPDLFDESAEIAAIEQAIGLVSWREPPAGVQDAVAAYKAVARRRLSVNLKALVWALGIGAATAGAIGLVAIPLAGAVAGAVIAAGVFWIARMSVAASYQWGTASVSRVGLEAWVREYARSRGLELRDRWRFHADHRALAMPGFADHVLAGEIPGAGIEGLFVLFGDAAEMRSHGVEVAYTSDRPLASNALVVDLERPLSSGAAERVELPDEYRLEVAGSQLIVWQPVMGNLLRTAAGSDRFRENAGAVIARVLSAR